MSQRMQMPQQWRREQLLPFALPDIDEHDIAAVVSVLRSRWITTGPVVRAFEEAFAARMGVDHAIALNSATAALHLALDAIDLQAGDEVIIPTYTFTASAEVVRYFNATPVLVDVDPETLNVDPVAVRAAITPRTRAVMIVHVAGHPAEMDELLQIAGRHALVVIEDAAHTLPALYRGRHAGTMGHLAAFSFYATKTITTAEGGMLVTNNPDYAERARVMALHGMSRDAWKRYTSAGSWRYDVIAPGFKYNMTDMAAALGLSQLRKVDRMWERRAAIAARYSEAFAEIPGLQVPTARPDVHHSWHLYILRLNLDRLVMGRDEFIEELKRRNIAASVHFIPVHSFSYYRRTYGLCDESFPVAAREWQRAVSLPIYPAMTDGDIADVIAAVREVVCEESQLLSASSQPQIGSPTFRT